ncbi:hypothetical protein ACLK1T_12610 [Escherichia coli]
MGFVLDNQIAVPMRKAARSALRKPRQSTFCCGLGRMVNGLAWMEGGQLWITETDR